MKLHYKFTPNIPANLLEESQIASNIEGIVSKETQLGVLSIVNDVPGELDKLKSEDSLAIGGLGNSGFAFADMLNALIDHANREGVEPVDLIKAAMDGADNNG